MRVHKRVRALSWFLFWYAFFSLAFTRAYWIADSLLSLAIAIIFSMLVVAKVRQLWKYRSDPEMRIAIASSGQSGIFNARWRRWMLDEQDDNSN